MNLIVEPTDGVAPLLAAIKSARKTVDIAIFRFDHKAVETALTAAAARGVRVTALIAFVNRGGGKSLRKLESRLLAAGVIVARTAEDLVRYHAKYIVIDRRTLYVLSFNFTRLDIDHSRGFGLVTRQPACVKQALKLFAADRTRTRYKPGDALVVSPANSRRVLGAFLKRAKKELLIFDPRISDKEMRRILQQRTAAGVEVRVIGSVPGKMPFAVRKLGGHRLHTRTIIADRRRAFVGSQSLRAVELDSRREVGLIVRVPKVVRKLVDVFESDWNDSAGKREVKSTAGAAEVAPETVAAAVGIFKKELQPLTTTVRKAVQRAVVKAGDDVLHDKDIKDTMKKVVKQAVKKALKTAVSDVQKDLPQAD